MILKWRWVQREDRRWIDNLIGYSRNNKEHIYYLNEALKKLQRKDCVRLIVENANLEK